MIIQTQTSQRIFVPTMLLTAGLVSLLALAQAQTDHSQAYHPVPINKSQPLQGSESILKQLRPDKAASKAPPKSEELTALRASIKEFNKEAPTMPAQQAATTWLALADRYMAYGQQPQSYSMRSTLSFNEIVAAVPPPAAWPALTQAIEARQPYQRKSARDLSFLLLSHVLTGNNAGQLKAFAALRAQINTQSADDPYGMSRMIPVLALALAKNSGDSKRIIQTTKDLPAEYRGMGLNGEMTSARIEAEMAAMGRGYNEVPLKQVPDLVTLQGATKAQAQLRQMLLTSRAELYIPLGNETIKLAQKLALAHVNQLKVPQWTVAHSLNNLALFEAMERRFMPANAALTKPVKKAAKTKAPKPQKGTPSYQMARTYYLLGLIVVRRANEASGLAIRMGRAGAPLQIGADTLSDLDNAGHTLALNNFLRDLLSKDARLPFWSSYITVAVRAGQSDSMLALVRKMASQNKNATRVFAIRQTLYGALLATDHVTEGVGILRQLLKVPKPAASVNAQASRFAMATTLAKVGQVTGHPEWVSEGVQIMRASQGTMQSYLGEASIASILVELGRDAEAEKELVKPLKTAMARASLQETSSEDYMMEMADYSSLSALTTLAGIYHRRGQHKDVLNLLEKAPWWPAKDLSEIANSVDTTGIPLGYMAAAALLNTGQKDQALTILKTILHTHNGFDPAYRLLVDQEGEASIETLDKLFDEDRFEERPLIWKAHVLYGAKRLEEAEKVVRQAIAIDPSDGEQGKDNRMRAYAVLANIRAARGDEGQANLFRGAVKAIRVSEKADDVYNAGLLTRGIRMYKQALTYFADAYCIQSRIAIQLASQGRYEEAEAHYRRAFELMPDSFGRLESHCFGCEGAFTGARATNLAESVFQRLLVKTPNKPQVHYLMGYLRSSQGRYREAITNYRRAVQLDKDYINAWNKLLEAGATMELPKADREAAVFNLLRLDPSMRHSTPDFSQVSDLKKLWDVFQASQSKQTDDVSPALLPLTASIPFAEKREERMKKMLEDYGMSKSEYDDYLQASQLGKYSSRRFTTAGQAIAANRAIAAIVQIIDYQKQLDLMKTYGMGV